VEPAWEEASGVLLVPLCEAEGLLSVEDGVVPVGVCALAPVLELALPLMSVLLLGVLLLEEAAPGVVEDCDCED
jgi:hypothetical protein